MIDPRRAAVVKIIYHAMTHGPIYSAGAVADQVFAALAAAEPGDAELATEQRLIDADHRENLALIDYIANKIGLPHDQELSQYNFMGWFSGLHRLQPGDAERVREEAAKWHENQIVDRRDLAMCQDRIRIAILDENRKHAEAAKAIRSIPISPREADPHLAPLNRAEADEAKGGEPAFSVAARHSDRTRAAMERIAVADAVKDATAPAKTEDEAWVETASTAMRTFRNIYEHPWDVALIRKVIDAADIARFGGDPGEKIRLQNARIRQLEALLDAKKSPKVEGEFPHHVVKAAQIAFDAHQRSAPADTTFWPMRAALSAARAALQPRSETP